MTQHTTNAKKEKGNTNQMNNQHSFGISNTQKEFNPEQIYKDILDFKTCMESKINQIPLLTNDNNFFKGKLDSLQKEIVLLQKEIFLLKKKVVRIPILENEITQLKIKKREKQINNTKYINLLKQIKHYFHLIPIRDFGKAFILHFKKECSIKGILNCKALIAAIVAHYKNFKDIQCPIDINQLDETLNYCFDLIDAGNNFIHQQEMKKYNIVFTISSSIIDEDRLLPFQLSSLLKTLKNETTPNKSKLDESFERSLTCLYNNFKPNNMHKFLEVIKEFE